MNMIFVVTTKQFMENLYIVKHYLIEIWLYYGYYIIYLLWILI